MIQMIEMGGPTAGSGSTPLVGGDASQYVTRDHSRSVTASVAVIAGTPTMNMQPISLEHPGVVFLHGIGALSLSAPIFMVMAGVAASAVGMICITPAPRKAPSVMITIACLKSRRSMVITYIKGSG